LRIDLLRLRRSRASAVRASIAPDEELWTDSGLRFSGPVEVDGSAALTAEGGVVVRGSWKAPVLYECGRCLDAFDVAVERPLTLLYVPSGGWETENPDVRTIGYQQTTLDLREAIREEVLLEVPRYFLPVEKKGRCTECGDPVERFRMGPEEPESGTDPRWAALKALQTD
jgi:uncharacterized metal-binding protein YceD (DUF177 family)